MGRKSGQPSHSLRDIASRCAGSKGHAWFVRGLRGMRLAALAAALRRQSGQYQQRHSPSGGNWPLRGQFHITRHSVKFAPFTTLRFVPWGDPALRRALRVERNRRYVLRPCVAAKPISAP